MKKSGPAFWFRYFLRGEKRLCLQWDDERSNTRGYVAATVLKKLLITSSSNFVILDGLGFYYISMDLNAFKL